MGSNARRAAVRGAVVIWCAAAACSPPDFDPRSVTSAMSMPDALPREQPLVPAFAVLESSPATAAAAPLAEIAVEAPLPRALTIALGRDAASVCGTQLERAFAAALPAFAAAPSACSDRDAIELVLQGRADFALVASKLSEHDQTAGLCSTRLGVELWALAASDATPLRSLTRSQMRQVLTAQVHSWIDLGQNGGALTVYVPADRGTAERAARLLIPGDPFAATCVGLDDAALAAALRNPGAIGVVRVGRPLPDGVRLLQIDWSPATLEAHGIGTYPFGAPLALVTAGQPVGASRDLATFLRSQSGRELLGDQLLTAK